MGAIAGGVIGGVAGLAAILALIFFCRTRRFDLGRVWRSKPSTNVTRHRDKLERLGTVMPFVQPTDSNASGQTPQSAPTTAASSSFTTGYLGHLTTKEMADLRRDLVRDESSYTPNSLLADGVNRTQITRNGPNEVRMDETTRLREDVEFLRRVILVLREGREEAPPVYGE